MREKLKLMPALPVWMLVGTVALGVWAGGISKGMAESEEALAKARQKDPAWAPACREVSVIRVGKKGKGGFLNNYCLHTNGNILACWKGNGPSDPPAIKVLSPEGRPLETWKLDSEPQAICVRPDGAVFIGGGGKLLKLDAAGHLLASADSPVAGQTAKLSPEFVKELKSDRNMSEKQIADYQQSLERRRTSITGIAATARNLFVVCPSTTDFSYVLYRTDLDLKNPKLIIKGLHGCCGQMDVQANGDKVWIPHNARHRVEAYDLEGKQLSQFGKNDSKAADGFGGCCEPKNLRFGPKGDLFAAESGTPVVIKRFSQEGKFLGVVGLPNFKTSCVRVTVEVSQDEKRFYILDTGEDAIHVLAPKS